MAALRRAVGETHEGDEDDQKLGNFLGKGQAESKKGTAENVGDRQRGDHQDASGENELFHEGHGFENFLGNGVVDGSACSVPVGRTGLLFLQFPIV